MNATAPSIHELPPLECGGVIARHGFAFQDHVAARHCLEMLADTSLEQVWCETQDDVTLLWRSLSGDSVEFVQVKGNEFDQLWSIAKLLERDKAEEVTKEESTTAAKGQKNESKSKKQTFCILEKSLQYDRCKEHVRFRIVTARPVKDELRFLTYPVDSEHRDKKKADYLELLKKLKKRVGSFKSTNGNDCTFWLDRTLWESVHSLDALRTSNLWAMSKLVVESGHYLTPDQISEVYQRLLTKVYDGGLAKWDKEAGKKKIERTSFVAWFATATEDVSHPARKGTGRTLTRKLQEAGIDPDQFEAISEMRQRYRMQQLTPRYNAPESRSLIEGEIRARLLTLRSNLDGTLIQANGVKFHALCINEINSLRTSLKEDARPPAENLYGYMYDLADRCTHRFVRART